MKAANNLALSLPLKLREELQSLRDYLDCSRHLLYDKKVLCPDLDLYKGICKSWELLVARPLTSPHVRNFEDR